MFNVMTRNCDQCLLGPDRIVSGTRAAQIIRDCRRKDAHFICHKSPSGQEIACRGYYDLYGGQMARIAERLRMVREIDPDTLPAIVDQSPEGGDPKGLHAKHASGGPEGNRQDPAAQTEAP